MKNPVNTLKTQELKTTWKSNGSIRKALEQKRLVRQQQAVKYHYCLSIMGDVSTNYCLTVKGDVSWDIKEKS